MILALTPSNLVLGSGADSQGLIIQKNHWTFQETDAPPMKNSVSTTSAIDHFLAHWNWSGSDNLL